jgi:prephenate dehydrogenase
VDVFIRILCNNGHRISVYDIDKKKTVNLSNQYKCKPCKSIQEIAKESDTVILCTPLKETPYIINQVTKYITPGSMIVEIASLKKRTIAALRRHEDKIKPLSIHPMFGPDIKEIRGHTIVVVPVKNQVLETNCAQNLFPEVEIIIADEDAHDQSMAFILSLP